MTVQMIKFMTHRSCEKAMSLHLNRIHIRIKGHCLHIFRSANSTALARDTQTSFITNLLTGCLNNLRIHKNIWAYTHINHCNTAKNADERNKAATTPYLARTDSRMMPRQRNSSNRGAITTSVMIAQKPRP